MKPFDTIQLKVIVILISHRIAPNANGNESRHFFRKWGLDVVRHRAINLHEVIRQRSVDEYFDGCVVLILDCEYMAYILLGIIVWFRLMKHQIIQYGVKLQDPQQVISIHAPYYPIMELVISQTPTKTHTLFAIFSNTITIWMFWNKDMKRYLVCNILFWMSVILGFRESWHVLFLYLLMSSRCFRCWNAA